MIKGKKEIKKCLFIESFQKNLCKNIPTSSPSLAG